MASSLAAVDVFAPEKFVAWGFHGAPPQGWGIPLLDCSIQLIGTVFGTLGMVVTMPLDLAAIVALFVATVPDRPFPPALLVGYSVTALGFLFLVFAFFDEFCPICRCVRKWQAVLDKQVDLV